MPEPHVPVVVLTGTITRADIPRVCARVRELLADHGVVEVDVTCARAPDLAVIDALARLRLTVKRAGAELRVRATPEVAELLDLTGLSDVVPLEEMTPLED